MTYPGGAPQKLYRLFWLTRLIRKCLVLRVFQKPSRHLKLRKDSKGRSLLAISVAAGRNEVVGTLLRPLPMPVPVVPPENDKAK